MIVRALENMKKDQLVYPPSDFQFNQEVSECFDDMAKRSIPFYQQSINMSAQLTQLYYLQETVIYDLGFSTANFPIALSKVFDKDSFSYIGLDSSAEMATIAQQKILSLPKQHQVRLLVEDINQHQYLPASVFFANYTFQFIRPMQRLPLLRKIFSSLSNGGILLLSEKVLESDGNLSRQFIDLYYRYKKENGYSDLEISQKREALENVLVPYRLQENIELLKLAGFSQVEIFFKWFNFASLIAVKSW